MAALESAEPSVSNMLEVLQRLLKSQHSTWLNALLRNMLYALA